MGKVEAFLVYIRNLLIQYDLYNIESVIIFEMFFTKKAWFVSFIVRSYSKRHVLFRLERKIGYTVLITFFIDHCDFSYTCFLLFEFLLNLVSPNFKLFLIVTRTAPGPSLSSMCYILDHALVDRSGHGSGFCEMTELSEFRPYV
jgi:hypothetical protein